MRDVDSDLGHGQGPGPPGLQRRGPREGGAPVQVPAPFDYVRATSVDNALELLERHGPESRVIAGGHSLLPMMKLRLARPEWLIDINDVAELRHITEERRRAAGRRADPARGAARVRRRRAALPDRARRREGHRRPGGAQPRHDRRLARPGRPGRGPHHRLRRPPRPGRHRRARRRARRRHGRLPPRPVRDRVRAARADHRDPVPDPGRARAAPTRRSSAGSATGPSAPPAPRSGWPRTARSPTPRSGSPPLGLEGLADRRRRRRWSGSGPARTCSPRPGRWPREASSPVEDQRGPVDYKRHLAGELTRRVLRRALDRAGPPLPPPEEADDAGHHDRQRDRGHPRRRTAAAARALPARDARPDRHPLGLRHQQLRHLRRAGRRRAGEVVHRARRHGRRPRGAHGRGHGRRTARSTRCSRASWRSTACSAASAPPG